MLAVTQAATAALDQLLSDAPDQACVRILQQENDLKMVLDEPRPGDTTFEHGEKTVLALDTDTAGLVDNRTLDVEETEKGAQLVLK